MEGARQCRVRHGKSLAILSTRDIMKMIGSVSIDWQGKSISRAINAEATFVSLEVT